MLSSVVFKLPDAREVCLVPGDLIGRLWNAALRLRDPRVSEAHAYVSLRGKELQLLALRGRFAVKGKRLDRVTLRPGVHIDLAQGLTLEVVDVWLPPEVMALTTAGLPPQILSGTCSIVTEPEPRIELPGHPRAVATVWAEDTTWFAEAPGHEPVALTPDEPMMFGGLQWMPSMVPVASIAPATVPDLSMVESLRIVPNYDVLRIERDGRAPVVISGIPARLVSELAALGPVDWRVLAGEIWRTPDSRKRLDMAVARLRQKLRAHGIRSDIVRPLGNGVFALHLMQDDQLVTP